MTSDYPDHNPYDFIMNPGTPAPKKIVPTIPNNKNGFIIKLALIIGGAIVLIIGLMIGSSLLSKDTTGTTDLTAIAQTQNELVRVTVDGTSNARDQAVRNFAVNSNLSLSTQQVKLLSYLGSKGTKLNSKQLKLKENDNTTKQLLQAKQTSTYDAAFLQIMQTSLDSYANDLQKLYQTASSATVKSLLKADYEQTQLLKSQMPSSASSASSGSSTTTQ